jgi:hypothetical protein
MRGIRAICALTIFLLIGIISRWCHAEEVSISLEYDVTAILNLKDGVVEGSGEVMLRNRGSRPTERLLFVCYPNRFRAPDPGLNDINFMRYYAYRFRPGWMCFELKTHDGRLLDRFWPDSAGIAKMAAERDVAGRASNGWVAEREANRQAVAGRAANGQAANEQAAEWTAKGQPRERAVERVAKKSPRGRGAETLLSQWISPPLLRREREAAHLGCFRVVRLPKALAPKAAVRLSLRFKTMIPERLGPFGRHGGRVTLEGGFLPYIAFRAPDGRTGLAPPSPSRYKVALEICGGNAAPILGGMQLTPGGKQLASGGGILTALSRGPSLCAGSDLVRIESVRTPGGPEVQVFGSRDDRKRARRVARVGRLAAEKVIARNGLDGKAVSLHFIEAPLRDRLVHVCTDGVVLYSDRLFGVFPLLQGLHEIEVGLAAVQALLLQAGVSGREGADALWVAEGLAWLIARRAIGRGHGLTSEQVREGLGFFSFIPAIDRMLKAPRFASSDVYYGRFYEPWNAVRDEFTRFGSRRPWGRLVVEKLRDRIGEKRLLAVVDRYLESLGEREKEKEGLQFRDMAAEAAAEDLADFFRLWLGPPPRARIRIAAVGGIETKDKEERIRVKVERSTDDPLLKKVGDPIVVQVRSGGVTDQKHWDGVGERITLEFPRRGFLYSARLDPDERLNESHRGDDEWPVFAKFLLNRFSVHLDLNDGDHEIALGCTLIPLHDYRHAVILDSFYERDARGVRLGYARSFGFEIDRTRYVHTATAGINLEKLDTALADSSDSREEWRTLASLWCSYGFDTRITGRDPTTGFGVDLALEYTDKVFGTKFRFLSASGSLHGLYTPLRGHTFAFLARAGHVFGTDIPTERLFDLGGEGAIRGVDTGDFEETDILTFAAEYRHTFVRDLDINLLWLAWLREIQGSVFAEWGNVEDEFGDLFRYPNRWKVGVGYGIRLHGDVFGVRTTALRFDVAVRVDDADDVDPQYFLGAGQSF